MQKIDSKVEDMSQALESLRGRLSGLSEASRLVSENLDLDIVLQEVVNAACSLIGARYGALLAYSPSGEIQGFFTSGNLPPGPVLLDLLPDRQKLLDYMDDLRTTVRISDISEYSNQLGLPEGLPDMKSFLGMPVRHQGLLLGNIFLTEKEAAGEFTEDDEEVLVMFASQAGAAILSARRFEDEKQARANLEVLHNVCPAAILVFDAKTGNLARTNEEARSLFGKLNLTGKPLQEILEVVSMRRADGSKIPLEEAITERVRNSGEAVFAEEVSFSLPDGRTITTLVSARPVLTDNGEITSVITTIQDITYLEELKRQRSEFLSDLSHELRVPLAAIRGSTTTLLDASIPHAELDTQHFASVIDEQVKRVQGLLDDFMDMTNIEAGTLSVNSEPADVTDLMEQARSDQLIRDLGHGVSVAIAPATPGILVDRRRFIQVLRKLATHVSRAAPATSTISLSASPWDVYVEFVVACEYDNPPGQSHTLQREFSRVFGHDRESRVRRNFLDLVICEGLIEAHGGRLVAEDKKSDSVSRFVFTIPVVSEAEFLERATSNRTPATSDSEGLQPRAVASVYDPETGRSIRNHLSEAGFAVTVTSEADMIDSLVATHNPDVILIELSLTAEGPDLIKHFGSLCDAPVLFISRQGWDLEMGRAFELGAFDYLIKPFSPAELVVRTQVAIQRSHNSGWSQGMNSYQHGSLCITYGDHRVIMDGHPVQLTPTEYKLLTKLAMAGGRVLTHEQILEQVWGPLYVYDARILRTYVKSLRRKLGDNAEKPRYIFTEPGVGYRMPNSEDG